MSDITAAMVKELRTRSGAGMMDCKKALTDNNGDMEQAIDYLRTKGLASAAKKSGRVASEGLVATATSGNTGAMIELNAETDFVARNEQFQQFALELSKLALENGDSVEKLNASEVDGGTVESKLTDLIATIGENMQLRRVMKLSVKDGIIASYIHNSLAPSAGKIGVLVALESSGDKEKLEQLGKQIAMHVAAARPEALNIADLDADALERERAVLKEQALASGKPVEIIDKMMEGRIRKYYEQVVLTEQTYVIDGETKVSTVIDNLAKEIGTDIKITGYVRFELGEGIEKADGDFAAEVAAMAG